MKLSYFSGVNCHLLCLINIAAKLNVDYSNIFATLWSETSFTNNEKHQIYISKRIFKNFKACGIRINKSSYESIPRGSFFLVGMDTFDIPWSPVYQNFNGTHYFIAKKESSDIIKCFDPIYNKKYIRLHCNEIIPNAFDICSVTKTPIKTPSFSIENEAREILAHFPILQKSLYSKIRRCKDKNKENLTPIIKQIIAMISNRYMFKTYLQLSKSKYSRFFNKTFFNSWQALKNALYKASLQKNNSELLDEANNLLITLLQKEIFLAKKILKNT